MALVGHALSHVHRTFTYSVPDELSLAEGALVRVPFHGRRLPAVVVDVLEEPDVARTLPVRERLGPGLREQDVALARWLAARTLATLGECLAAMLPERVVSEERSEPAGAPQPSPGDLGALAVYERGATLRSALETRGGGGFVWRPLSADRVVLALEMVAAVAASGRGVIVLVPEVRAEEPLAAGMSERFGTAVARLGSDRSARARYRDWLALRAGVKRIALGGRAAIFAPVARLGLILIDDEGDASYKEGRAPRYHARSVAAERARREGAAMVLSGLPPSVEARAATQRGPYVLVAPPRALERRHRPAVTVVERGRLVPSAPTLAVARTARASGSAVTILTHRGGELAASVVERTARILGERVGFVSAERSERADIVVATSAIVHDAQAVGGLLAIVEADAALTRPEPRAAEEVFATWWRLAASASAVVIESADPQQPAVAALTRWDPDVLFRAEASRRRELGYPPFAALARIDVEPRRASAVAAEVAAAAPELEVLGPVRGDAGTAVVVRAARRDVLLEALAPLAHGWRERDEPVRVDVDPWEVLVPRWRSSRS